jgi:tRNA A-37 threonylcarbamoyl transferase component Bud32
VVVIAKHAPLLEKLGLSTLDQVKAFQGELVKDHRGRRDILRIRAIDADGAGRVLFLKRNWKPYRKDGLRSLLRHGRVWSQSRQEWENLRALEAAGLMVAGLVAYGEDCGPLWERFSFLITEAATGGQTVEQFIATCRDQALRLRVFEALARTIRKMHDAGLASPDLFTRHVFVDPDRDVPEFCLIDMARLDRHRCVSRALRARDLAALNLTAPLRFVSARERLRFLHAYAGSVDRRFVWRIRIRANRLLRTRRKFRDFGKGSVNSNVVLSRGLQRRQAVTHDTEAD